MARGKCLGKHQGQREQLSIRRELVIPILIVLPGYSKWRIAAASTGAPGRFGRNGTLGTLSSRFVTNSNPKHRLVHYRTPSTGLAAYRPRSCRQRHAQLCERAGSCWFTASPAGSSDLRSSRRWFPRASSTCSRFAVIVATRLWSAWGQPCTARSSSTHDDLSGNATRRLAANTATLERAQHRSILEPSKFGSTKRACAAD